MLGKSPARATYSVLDIAQAKQFYGKILGLDVTEDYLDVGRRGLTTSIGNKCLSY